MSPLLASMRACYHQVRSRFAGQIAIAGDRAVIIQVQGSGQKIVRPDQPHLELTRFEGLHRQTRGDPETGRPHDIDLIRPFARAIELVGRERDLESLREWLRGDLPVSVRVLTGQAGFGKTRLALELVEDVTARGWSAGFLTRRELTRFLGQTNAATWGWNAPVLAVVDYASASAGDLNALLRQLATHNCWNEDGAGRHCPLRLLLLERQATPGAGWWAYTFGRGDEAVLERMLDPRRPVALQPLAKSSARWEVVERTLRRLGSDIDLPKDADFARHLTELTWGGTPLFLIMAAVYAARSDFAAALALGADELSLHIAENELSRIRKVVNLDADLGALVDHLVAVATLRRGLAGDSAMAVIKEEAAELGYELPLGPAPLRDALAGALPDGKGGLAPVGPDMIGEAVLLSVWGGSEAALPAIRRAHAEEPFSTLETVIGTCRDYLIRGNRVPLNWLKAIVTARVGSHHPDASALIDLANAMPEHTVELREIALDVSQAVVDALRPLACDPGGPNNRAALAGSLHNQSLRLAALGRRCAAADSAQEAILILRDLAAGSPGAFEPDLGASLTNLATRLAALGRWGEGLEAAEEAVAIRRRLVTSRPGTLEADLMAALNNLSNHLCNVGQREAALRTACEAVEFGESLDATRSDAHRSNVAASLNTLSNCLAEVGRRQEALEAAEKAVVIRQNLAAAKPDAFRPDLAMAWNTLAIRRYEIGCFADALDAAGKSVELYDELSTARPGVFQSDLAVSLNNQSNCLWEVGRKEEALKSVERAVALYRGLATALPDVFRPLLAGSLNNLSNYLAKLSRSEEARDAVMEAVALYRGLATAFPDVFRPDLADSLNNQSNCLSQAGRSTEALDAINEAVVLHRGLADACPEAFRPKLSVSLNNLSNRLWETGRREDALDTVEEAVLTLRGPFLAVPSAFASDMDIVFANYVNQFRQSHREVDAELSEPIKEALACIKDS
ncbi:MAG: tetratricopeptide repeat protein [Acidobacteria bacterium]|nr:tetratricopeptide repeat protein [Acidobacteriota bacterium]